MVSFLCHACRDVVKKPKLDRHHGRCRSGFDCIDCLVTFNTPAEFKSHTACVSEAEKYQKSLYKRPKLSQKPGYTNAEGGSRGGQGDLQGQARGLGRGSFQCRGYYGGRQPRDQGTGANGTPLGSPRRMSPVTPVGDAPSKSNTEDVIPVAPLPSADAAPISSLMKNVETELGPSTEQSKKGKKSKDKKSKSTLKTELNAEVQANGPSVVEHQSVLPPISNEPPEKKDKKKKKKKKKKEEQTQETEKPKVEQEKSDDSKEGKKRKKKSKDDRSTDDPKMVGDTSAKGNVANRADKTGIDDHSRTVAEEKPIEPKEKKLKSKRKTPVAEAPDADPEGQGGINESEDRKQKKRKVIEKVLDKPPAPPTESANTVPQNEESEKEKKRKRAREGTEDGGDRKKSKKSSKKDTDSGDMASAVVVKESTSKEPPTGEKCKREVKDDAKNGDDVTVPGNATKEKKKRKPKKEAESS